MSDPVKPCWLPVTEVGDPGPFASHYHGTPWLAEGEAWPTHDDVPLVLILQMRVDTLPEPMAALLGGCGLVQFFYPAEESEATWNGGGGLLRLVQPLDMPFAPPATVTAVTSDFLSEAHALMVGIEDDSMTKNPEPRAPRAIVGWRRTDDFPDPMEAEEGYYAEYEDSKCLFGDKLAGWPYWIQDPNRLMRRADGVVTEVWQQLPEAKVGGEEMIPFYQFGTDSEASGNNGPSYSPFFFGFDGGTLHLSVLKSDPTVMGFRWACT